MVEKNLHCGVASNSGLLTYLIIHHLNRGQTRIELTIRKEWKTDA